MEREILFRGKKELTGEWIYGSLIQPVSCIKSDRVYIGDFWSAESVYPATVGQYTGMTDKNGVKIFDGDIISIEYCGEKCLGYVRFSNRGFFAFVPLKIDNFFYEAENEENIDLSLDLFCLMFESSDCKGGTVVGNIFDNKELLEVQNEAD